MNAQVVAARVNDRVVDLSRPLSEDCAISPVGVDSPDGVEVLRHSTAHLLAQAVKRLFPEVQITIGPVIADGFYYDFKRDQPFTPEDLERIETVMREIAKQNLPVRRETMPRAAATEMFRAMGEAYKAEIIAGIPEDVVSLYRQGEFVDLCRGPHVPATGAPQGVQAHQRRRRLLARRRAQRDAAAHLRHRVPEQGAAGSAPPAHRGGEAARPPPPRPAAGSVLAAPDRPGLAVFPSQGRRRLQHAWCSTCAASTGATATPRWSRR